MANPRNYVERLSGDEALRSNLSDDEARPIINAACELTIALARFLDDKTLAFHAGKIVGALKAANEARGRMGNVTNSGSGVTNAVGGGSSGFG